MLQYQRAARLSVRVVLTAAAERSRSGSDHHNNTVIGPMRLIRPIVVHGRWSRAGHVTSAHHLPGTGLGLSEGDGRASIVRKNLPVEPTSSERNKSFANSSMVGKISEYRRF